MDDELQDLPPTEEAGAGEAKSGEIQSNAAASGETGSGESQSGEAQSGSSVNLELLMDVDLPVSVAFGNTEMTLKDVMNLGTGSVIELNKSVNDPVSIIVNQKPIARGEVVMIDGKYGVRVLEVESTADRIRSLG